jgi:2-iminoacetate synthase ThiH
MNFPHLQSSFERQLSMIAPHTAAILDRALSGQDITVDEATSLFDAEGSALMAMIAAADHLRARTVGDVVTYVINRNINFTNVCVKACGFCAFSRGHLAEQGYFFPTRKSFAAPAKLTSSAPAKFACRQAWLPEWTVGST